MEFGVHGVDPYGHEKKTRPTSNTLGRRVPENHRSMLGNHGKRKKETEVDKGICPTWVG